MLNGEELTDQIGFTMPDRIVVKSNPYRGLPTYRYLTIPNDCSVSINGKTYLILEEDGEVGSKLFDGATR